MVDSVVQKKCSCHRAMHSGSDDKVLPALSLIRVEKLRLPDRSDRSSRKRVP